jgi:hypothetical protein
MTYSILSHLLEGHGVSDPGVWAVELLPRPVHHAVLRLGHAGQAHQALEPREEGRTACRVQELLVSTQATPD